MLVPYAVALFLASAPAAPVVPEPADATDPAIRAAAERCLTALRKRDWKALAEQIHPEALEKFRSAAEPALKHALEPRRDKDGTPNFGDAILMLTLEKVDLKKLLSLREKAFFETLATALMQEQQKRLFAGMDAKVIGTVREGKIVHVLYRAKGPVVFAEGSDDQGKGEVKKRKLVGEATRIGVLSFQRSGKEWKALVPDEIQELVTLLTAKWKE